MCSLVHNVLKYVFQYCTSCTSWLGVILWYSDRQVGTLKQPSCPFLMISSLPSQLHCLHYETNIVCDNQNSIIIQLSIRQGLLRVIQTKVKFYWQIPKVEDNNIEKWIGNGVYHLLWVMTQSSDIFFILTTTNQGGKRWWGCRWNKLSHSFETESEWYSKYLRRNTLKFIFYFTTQGNQISCLGNFNQELIRE